MKFNCKQILIICLICILHLLSAVCFAQCPELTDNTLSGGCFNGGTPCDLCPGEIITLGAEGSDLPDGGCVDWYYSDDPGFNPYNGEGNFIACGDIETDYPPICTVCPKILAIYVDACGTEALNEYMLLSSGSGFNVNNLQVDFSFQNNMGGAQNLDINWPPGSCTWKVPEATLINNLTASSNCNSSNIIPVGPGGSIPANAIVAVFTSSGENVVYSFDNLCAAGYDIYVMQSSCTRTIGAFTNGNGSGLRTQNINIIGCPCFQTLDYICEDLAPPNDGDYILADGTIGSTPCTAPDVQPELVPGISNVADVTFEVTEDLCNLGPFYIIGILNPAAPTSCDEVSTPNLYSFNVVCPEAVADVQGPACFGESVTIEGEGGGTYKWTGPSNFNSTLQSPTINNLNLLKSGTYNLTVTNSAGCTDDTSVELIVNPEINLEISPSDPEICQGDFVTLMGMASGGSENFTYEWTLPSGDKVGDQNIDVDAEGIYTLVVTDLEGCTKQTTETVTVNALPQVEIDPSSLSLCIGGSAIISASSSGGTPAYSYLWSTGENGDNITVMGPGIIEVTVTDSKGCMGSSSIEITQATPPNVSISPDPAKFCNGSSIQLTASGSAGNSPYSYSWTTPTGNVNYQVVQADESGNYTVTVTDESGCTATQTLAVVENSIINIKFNPDPASFCKGGSVSLTATASGGSGSNYQYNWTTASGTANGSNITAGMVGNYIVTVTDGENCTATASINVTETNTLTVSIKPDPVSICPGNSVDISAGASGGSGSFMYNWTTPTGSVTGQTIKASNAGSYEVTVTDSNGCSGLDTLMVTEDADIPVSILPDPASFCTGGNVKLTASSSAGGSLTYNWTTPSGTKNGDIIIAGVAGTYTVTVSNGNGCSGTASVEVTETSKIDVNITPKNPGICKNSSIDLTANTSAGGSLEYKWTTPGGKVSGQTITASISGEYIVTITDQGGCTGTATIHVNEYPGLDIKIDPDPPSFCTNGSIEISAVNSNGIAPFTYEWTTPSVSGNNQVFTAGIAGIYTVLVTDANACTGTASTTVTESNTLTLNFKPEPAGFCKDKTVDLTVEANGGKAPFNYQWTSAIGNFNTANVVTGTSGTYKATVTDVNGCSGSGEVIVDEFESPKINLASKAGFCKGDNYLLDAKTSGGLTPFIYNWSTPSVTKNTESFSINEPGSYNVTVTNVAGCSAEASIEIEEWDTPIIEYKPDPVQFCSGKSVDVVVESKTGSAPFTYQWTWSGGTNFGNSLNITEEDTYTIILRDTNACADTAVIEASEIPGLSVTLSTDPAQICEVDQFDIISTITGGNQPYDYTWNGPSGNANTPNLAASDAGTYSLTVTDVSGCSGSKSITLINEAFSVVIDKTDPGCKTADSGSIEIVSAINPSYPLNLIINNNPGININLLPYKLENLKGGNYYLVIKGSNGCDYNELLELSLGGDLQLDLGPDITIYSGESVEMNPTSSFTIDSIFWNTNNYMICDPGCISPTVAPLVNTNYKATAYDEQGCNAKDEINVYVTEKQSVYVPNTFSPDANGINDKWVIFTDGNIKQIKKLYIYDRWGEALFIQENFPPDDAAFGWDGKFRGKKMNTGVYVYYFEAEYLNGTVKVFKGDINILR